MPTTVSHAAPAAAAGLTAQPPECLIRFWGVRGSIPSPGPATVHYGGNTSCVEIRAGGEVIVLDAGTGIRLLGLALGEEFGARPIRLTLLISHTHWDHIQGFPFFRPAYGERNSIRILGFEGARAGLASTISGQMESAYFPVPLAKMRCKIGIDEIAEPVFAIGAVRVRALRVNHPGLAMGFRLETPAGSVVYIPDCEPVRDTDAGPQLADELIEFARGADILIEDAQYTAAEYRRHCGWGHGSVDDVVELATRAGVKRLFLFHHDPDHDDRTIGKMVDGARDLAEERGATLRIDGAREGEIVVLKGRRAKGR